MDNLFDKIAAQANNHAKLISAGINNEQALRIAYGDEVARVTKEQLGELCSKNFIPDKPHTLSRDYTIVISKDKLIY